MFFILPYFLGFRNPRKKERKENIPRKKGKYFPKLLVLDSTKKVRDVQMIVLPFGVWVIGLAPRRVRKIN